MMNWITWPHGVLYTCTEEPAVYEEMDSMAFVNGYITVMAGETESTKFRMLIHLQEFMEDGEAYG